MSAVLTAFVSDEDFCEWEGKDKEDMAESIDDVRGITRGRSPGPVEEFAGDVGADVCDCTGLATSDPFCD